MKLPHLHLLCRRVLVLEPLPKEDQREVEQAAREAEGQRRRFVESLLEKAAHARFPFLRDPFE